MAAQVIILNGIGSAGKSSAAKELQKITKLPFLHVQGDGFLEMMPPSLFGDTDGIIFKQSTVDDVSPIATSFPNFEAMMAGLASS